ncbi:hypothetical protein [Halobacteriaceae bacterium SHR40]|uniref:hypothetical protein n=1 Tax=Halovenus amylolytica TaxID=2500550 RepID=UPI000FE32FC8
MSSRILYRGLFAVVAIVSLAAVAVGVGGLYTVFTGGTDTADESSLLGEFQCEEFDGDPEMPHESEIGEPLTVRGDSQLDSFNTTTVDGERAIEIETAGPLINASARRPDGTVLAVDRFPEENRLVVTAPDRRPFRLFVDSLNDEGTAVRTALDICPPETA